MKNNLKAFEFDSPESGLRKCVELSQKVVFSTSFGKEDQVITDMVAKLQVPIDIFTLDTGRLFEETYAVYDRTLKKYKLNIKVYTPDKNEVQNLVSQKGPYSFYDSIENRKECCAIRKIKPLQEALEKAEVWVTGLRREQSANRNEMEAVEWDQVNNVVKIHPLFDWTKEQLDEYISLNNIPVNTLHKKGFPSIGCSPCTRAILETENDRDGRWWWESSKKECGLHQVKQ